MRVVSVILQGRLHTAKETTLHWDRTRVRVRERIGGLRHHENDRVLP